MPIPSSILLWEDFIVLWKDFIVFGEDSIVFGEDSIVLGEDSIVLGEDYIVLKQKKSVRKLCTKNMYEQMCFSLWNIWFWDVKICDT